MQRAAPEKLLRENPVRRRRCGIHPCCCRTPPASSSSSVEVLRLGQVYYIQLEEHNAYTVSRRRRRLFKNARIAAGSAKKDFFLQRRPDEREERKNANKYFRSKFKFYTQNVFSVLSYLREINSKLGKRYQRKVALLHDSTILWCSGCSSLMCVLSYDRARSAWDFSKDKTKFELSKFLSYRRFKVTWMLIKNIVWDVTQWHSSKIIWFYDR